MASSLALAPQLPRHCPGMAELTFLNLGIQKLFQFTRLLSSIKADILLAQPQDQSLEDSPPEVLPPSIARFIEDALALPTDSGQLVWESLKGSIWSMDGLPMLVDDDYIKFKQFGWDRGLSKCQVHVTIGVVDLHPVN